jgi:hypothetical protein
MNVFCLRFQMEYTQVGILARTCCCFWCPEAETSNIYCVKLSRFYLQTETQPSLRNVVF